MSRTFDLSTESPAPVAEVLSAFGDEEYWRARIAAFDGNASLESLVVDARGVVTVSTVADLARTRLPGVVAMLIPGDLRLVQDETWRPTGDGRAVGELTFSVPAGLGSGRATAHLTPLSEGSRLTFTVAVEVKVPVLARRIENHIGNQFAEQIPAIQRFTTEWISDHATR